MNKGIVFFDGKFWPMEKAVIPVTDLAVQRGVGLFETLRTYNRVPFLLKERLRRLFDSAKILGIPRPLPNLPHRLGREKIEQKVQEGIRKFRDGEAVVKIILTAGDGHGFLPESKSRLIIIFSPFVPRPKQYYEKGISILSVPLSRPVPELKSLSYIEAAVAHKQALEKGYEEAVYRDRNNGLLEGTNFNFAIIKDRQIITPNKQILNGFTMLEVLRQAKNLGLKIIRRSISRQDLRGADESFITSATREVIPVVKVDTMKIGNGLPGKWSQILLGKYRENAEKQN